MAEQEKTNLKIWEIYLAAAIGAIALGLGDLLTNDSAATVLKIGEIIRKHIFDIQNIGTIGFVVLIVFGVLMCWVNEPKTKLDAFARGLSVFGILTVGIPYNTVKVQLNKVPSPMPKTEQTREGKKVNTISMFYGIPIATASEQEHPVEQYVYSEEKTNAVLNYRKGVSNCKPHYLGLFGLTSLINNRIGFCPESYVLPVGKRVQILDCWNTGFRGYRYVKIGYERDGIVKTGWVSSGKAPDYWQSVRPDDIKNVPSNCLEKNR